MPYARTPVRSWPNRPTAEPSPDVVIVGGGVIGCSVAYHLSLAGVGVLLLERERLAAGASGVAAGMLAPQAEASHDDAFFALALCGRAEHLPLATTLLDDVGLDVECRMSGILRVARRARCRSSGTRRPARRRPVVSWPAAGVRRVHRGPGRRTHHRGRPQLAAPAYRLPRRRRPPPGVLAPTGGPRRPRARGGMQPSSRSLRRRR